MVGFLEGVRDGEGDGAEEEGLGEGSDVGLNVGGGIGWEKDNKQETKIQFLLVEFIHHTDEDDFNSHHIGPLTIFEGPYEGFDVGSSDGF